MYAAEPFKGCNFFIYLGVVLHGAGPQRIEAVVHTVSALCKLGIVSGYLILRKLRQMKSGLTLQFFRKVCLRYIALGKKG